MKTTCDYKQCFISCTPIGVCSSLCLILSEYITTIDNATTTSNSIITYNPLSDGISLISLLWVACFEKILLLQWMILKTDIIKESKSLAYKRFKVVIWEVVFTSQRQTGSKVYDILSVNLFSTPFLHLPSYKQNNNKKKPSYYKS